MCTLCRDVLVLRIIAGHLFTAGDQDKGMSAVNLAGEMDEQLTRSYVKRTGEDRQPALYEVKEKLKAGLTV